MSYSLSYPKASEQAWYAVQKIIFEIDTAYDIRSSNLQNVIDFMNKSSLFQHVYLLSLSKIISNAQQFNIPFKD